MRKDALVDYQRVYTLNPNPTQKNANKPLHDSSEIRTQLEIWSFAKGKKTNNWWAVWKFSISGIESENYFRYFAMLGKRYISSTFPSFPWKINNSYQKLGKTSMRDDKTKDTSKFIKIFFIFNPLAILRQKSSKTLENWRK